MQRTWMAVGFLILLGCARTYEDGDWAFDAINAPPTATKGTPLRVTLDYSGAVTMSAGPVNVSVDESAKTARFTAKKLVRESGFLDPVPPAVIAHGTVSATFTPQSSGMYLLIAPKGVWSSASPGPRGGAGELTAQVEVSD